MNRWHPFTQLFLTRLREFYREPEAIFWVYGFPIILAVLLGVAFWNRAPEPPVVDVQRSPAPVEAEALAEVLNSNGVAAELHDAEACQQRLRTGKTTLVVVLTPEGSQYVYDPTRPESAAARDKVDAVSLRWKAGSSWPSADVPETEPGNRYIDFLVPGLIGMGLMGGGLWGVGFVLVDMRIRKLLKRLLATPMRRGDFLLSILSARLVFMVPDVLILLVVGTVFFGVPLRGGMLELLVIIVVGGTAFAGLGLLVACRADKTETISGLMNAVMMPMWLLSGTFFSSKRFPDFAQPFIQALPLTQLNNALREVMLEGASLSTVAWRLAILAAYAVVCFWLALKWFRWQ